MKVIGNTQSGFLLEATANEMALLKGYRSTSAEGYRKPDVGHDFELGKIADVSKFVRNLDENKLQYIKGQLERAIDEIDNAVDTAHSLTLFARLEEGLK